WCIKSVEFSVQMESGPPGPLNGSTDLIHHPHFIQSLAFLPGLFSFPDSEKNKKKSTLTKLQP
ncbi:MAG: hypothetical protein KDD10_28230, partial [Phaeodactylibacter sp.]|nr:hypothetical protein [Phaeodactylibacter sp.]